MALAEFELISRYFTPLVPVSVAGDDCAVIAVPTGHQLAVSTDTLVAGVHFPTGCDAEALAWRAVGCCGSDLAAMGATPLGFTLALTMPAVEPVWLAAFSRGLAAAAVATAMPLLGGDTTQGPLSVTLTVLGSVPAGGALVRRGGRPGDQVWISGCLGAAGAALSYLHQPALAPQLLEHYWRPQPRLELGRALLGIASAAIDISDGLIADLGHLCAASRCGAILDPAQVPLHPEAVALLGEGRARALAQTGGDDYELCFTAPASAAASIEELAETYGLALSPIGELVVEPGLRSPDGAALSGTGQHGYQHFGGPAC